MDYVWIGKIVNTHGIKGELRILSSFLYKDKVFIPGMKFYIGKKKECMTVTSYRPHKNFDMVTFEGYQNINDVLRLKGLSVYVLRHDIQLKEGEYLDTDLFGMDVIDTAGVFRGKVTSIRLQKGNRRLLEITNQEKKYLFPLQKELIEKVDLKANQIVVVTLKGLFV